LFTSGGTESVNLAFRFGCEKLRKSFSSTSQVLLTNWEYPSAHRTAADIASRGQPTNVLITQNSFGWKINDILQAIGDQPTFLSITLADGNTGIVQPVEELHQALVDAKQRSHVLLHVDASQAVGKMEVDFDRLGADYLSISGHKMYATKGVGALVIRDLDNLGGANFGDWYEHGIRNGMPNVPGIIGLAAAAQLVDVSVDRFQDRCFHLYDRFAEIIGDCCSPLLPSYEKLPNRLPNTWLLALKHGSFDQLAQRYPELCLKSFTTQEQESSSIQQKDAYPFEKPNESPKSGTTMLAPIDEVDVERFDSLVAIGVPRESFAQVLSISVGWNTTEAEIVHAAEVIRESQEQWK
jgi:cysteine sulfinate desulfinase/cysteine desulfurase-like protein